MASKIDSELLLRLYSKMMSYNALIIMVIGIISMTGLLAFGSFNGLWSLVLMFAMMSPKSKDKPEDED